MLGGVYSDTQFLFQDGEIGKKLFVVIGSFQGTYIVAKTTSQQHSRGTQQGCQPNDWFHNYYLPTGFDKPTWICLDELYKFESHELISKSFAGSITQIKQLSNALTRQIQDCALLSDDIIGEHEDIITQSLI